MTSQMLACFYIGGKEIAVDTTNLVEVIFLPENPGRELSLRGRRIHLVEVADLLGWTKEKMCEDRRVAVVRYHDHLVGLCFDRTSRVITANQQGQAEAPLIFSLSALDKASSLAEHLLNDTVVIDATQGPQKIHLQKCIVFRCGSLSLGFDMTRVQEIISLPKIEKSVLAVDSCVGLFRLRGMIIPVLDLRKFFAQTTESDELGTQKIMIVRKENRQIGLLVDHVESISHYFQEDLNFESERCPELENYLYGSVQTRDGKEIQFVKEDAILDHAEVLAISVGHKTLYGNSYDNRKVQRITDRRMYLRFNLQYSLSIRLNDVQEIAIPPKEMLSPQDSPSYVVGTLQLREHSLPVVDLKSFYGLGNVKNLETGRILVVQGAKGMYGLLVDSVEAIDTVDESLKVQLPHFLAKKALTELRGDVKEFVEMPDMSNRKKAFMIFDMIELLHHLDQKISVA